MKKVKVIKSKHKTSLKYRKALETIQKVPKIWYVSLAIIFIENLQR